MIGDGPRDEVVSRWANGLRGDKKINNVLIVTLRSKNTEAIATPMQSVTGELGFDFPCLSPLANRCHPGILQIREAIGRNTRKVGFSNATKILIQSLARADLFLVLKIRSIFKIAHSLTII